MPFKPIDPKPNFPKLEEKILKFWEDNQIFQKTLEQTRAGKLFTFYDGPPFATGLPHYGHILASTIKDLIPRYQTMKGRFVRRRWGWDCHGLPIEEIVERKLGISGKKDIEKLGIKKFNETCRSMVLQFVDEWRKTVRRIARWVDFDHSYKTMDRDYMESVWWAFKQIYDKGLIYEGRKVLLYCPRCETPISNFEVAMDNSYQEVTEEAMTVKFKVKSKKLKDTYFLAWTTTPWTLPGNVALAIGENIDYIKVKVGEEHYILAKQTADSVLHGRAKLNFTSILEQTFKGKDLVGLEYEPLFDVPAVKTPPVSPLKIGGEGGVYKVYAADFVNTEEGTGIVHTAVVYGEDDYNLGLKVGLPVVPLLDEKGKFNEKAPEFVRGKYFKDAEGLIKKDLEKRRLVFKREMHQHSYPHCWRCGTMLFYNAIPAWFINVQKIKKDLLKTNEKQINWYPTHLKHGRYQKSVESAPDWNISRNRYWGNPIPVWKCEDPGCSGQIVIGSIKELGLTKNTFIFTRHGEGEHNLKGIVSCWPEKKTYNLTAKGVERARGLAAKLEENGGADLIFASDLLRTKQTARTVGQILNVPVKFDARLREYNVGERNGQEKEKFDKEYPFENRWQAAPRGGETNIQAQARMVDFIHEINAEYTGKKILVVSHGDPLYLLMKYFGSELEYPKYATDFTLDVSITDLHRPYIDEVKLKCPICGKQAVRIKEIFDSWIEAGSMPFAEYHYPFDNKEVFESRFPAQFVAEYIAQTRAWFYIMNVVSQILFNQAPFENVITTGNVQNEKGEKLSKSKRNFSDPWQTIDKYGVDALRFYLMNSVVMQGDDLFFNEKDLATVYRKFTLILWNVYNYFVTYANKASFEPDQSGLKTKPKAVLDQWILAKTQELVNEVSTQLDNYDTVKTTRIIEKYTNDLSTWYVRRSRGRDDKEFFLTLRHSLLILAKVLAPVAPYLSEEIYKNLNRREEVPSVHLSDWPEAKKISKEDQQVLDQMALVRQLVEIGHSVRKAKGIKLRQPLALLTYSGQKLGKEFEKILADEMNVKGVKYLKSDQPNLKLDTKITKQLKMEGLAAELVRLVQNMRKQKGLKVGEMVSLSYYTDDKELEAAFKLVDTKKTYIKGVKRDKGIEGEKVEVEGKKIILKL